MLGGLVNAAISVLSGTWHTSSPDPETERQATIRARYRQQYDAALARGWLPWVLQWEGSATARGMSPYDFNYVWVWRPEWESLPIARTPHGGDPAMNVIGLLWKPWKAGETEEAMGRPLLTLQTRNAA